MYDHVMSAGLVYIDECIHRRQQTQTVSNKHEMDVRVWFDAEVTQAGNPRQISPVRAVGAVVFC